MNDYRETIKKEFEDIAEDYVNKAYLSGETIKTVDKFLKFLPKRGRILDIGCGGGQDSQQFSYAGYKVTGIDMSPRMIQLAKSFVKRGKFIIGDFLEVNLKDNHYVGVWCMRVFLLVPLSKQQEFLNKIYRILKQGGFLYIMTKANSTDTEEIDERGVFRKLITEDTFKNLLSRAGFDIVEFEREGKFMQAICRK